MAFCATSAHYSDKQIAPDPCVTITGTVWPAVALGRNNYLLAGSDAGGDRAAAFYSLIGTAKLCGLDPEACLRDVLTRIAQHPPQ